MSMTPGLHRLTLTAHVICSVGWLGAVACFLVLSVAAITSAEADLVRGCYLAMNLVGLAIIVPASLVSAVSGLLLALAGEWGLFRYYWVLVKFVLSTLIVIALLVHQFIAIGAAARIAAATAPGLRPDVGRFGSQLVVDAGLALVVLLVITAISVIKPWGRTAYGRSLPGAGSDAAGSSAVVAGPFPRGFKIFLAVIGALVVAFIALHLPGGGMHHGR